MVHCNYLGIQLRLRNSSESECQSFTYACPPGIKPIPMKWKMCCKPECDVFSEHVTYHKLKDDDDRTLNEVVHYYSMEFHVVGMMIVSSTDDLFISKELVDKAMPLEIPVYVISTDDGEQIENFISHQRDGDVEIKVYVDSPVDSTEMSTQPLSHHLGV